MTKLTRFPIQRDPQQLAADFLLRPKPTKIAIGLDLGTHCGVAVSYFVQSVQRPLEIRQTLLGQVLLDVAPYETGPMRFVRLRQFLNVLLPDIIFLEDVKYTPPKELLVGKSIGAVIARIATPAELLGAFKATVATWAEENSVPTGNFGSTEIKKYATGKGNANKSMMIKECNARFGTSYDPDNYKDGEDNEADAAFILDMGLSQYSKGV